MKYRIAGIASAILFSVTAMASDNDCHEEDVNTCRMAEFIADIMNSAPGAEESLSVTSEGTRVSYSVLIDMTRDEVDSSAVSMHQWASDAQATMCSASMIRSFLDNGGHLWYGLKGKDFEIPLLELRCRAS